MHCLKNDVDCMCYVIRILVKKKPSLLLILCFVNYVTLRLIRLSRFTIKLDFLKEKEFQREILRYCNDKKFYVDSNSCAFGNVDNCYEFPSWYYLCSSSSPKRYKILIINLRSISKNNVYVSDIMKFNIENVLKTDSKLCSYYLYPSLTNNVMCASEVRISQIINAHECPSDFVDSLLKNYFSKPRYLRSQDVFSVDIQEYCSDYYYSAINPNNTIIYFKVRGIRSKNSKENFHGFYVMQEKTILLLERAIQSYLPKLVADFHFEHFNGTDMKLSDTYSECLPCFEDSLCQLKTSIFPFLQKDMRIHLNPMFLIEGSEGSGKFKLVQIAARQLGLHLYDIDCRDIQTLTSVQTEAKLRVAISNAENSVPSIFCFRNIQVFGINAEGRKDDRIISALETEMKKVFDRNMNYPIIVIATSESSDLPVNLKRLFLENISLQYLDQTLRSNILSCLLKTKQILNEADLLKIAGLCSDFILADFEAFILHTIKIKYNIDTLPQSNETCTKLLDVDFNKAYEYMQSMLSNRIGTPHVPKVYWEDIGGIGDLKHEIIRRIELPLLNDIEISRSGLLLYGPPGTGKTLLAKAVATECQLHFFSIKGPELLNMYVGQSEKNVRQVFERARSAAPCIIFFDELDSLAPNRGQSGDSGGVMDRVVSQLLAEMDGLENSNNIFIIGATNRPDLIDPALLRPGRFDKMLYVGAYSDKSSQISVLKALTRQFKMENNGKELETLVAELPNDLSGADLYSVCSNAWLLAVRRRFTNLSTGQNKTAEINSSICLPDEEIVVELDDFLTAARDFTPTISMTELMQYQKLREKSKKSL